MTYEFSVSRLGGNTCKVAVEDYVRCAKHRMFCAILGIGLMRNRLVDMWRPHLLLGEC